LNARVLVTGASGFIGRRAVAGMRARGMDVHALSRSGICAGPGVADHVADLFDPIAVERVLADLRPTHLLHLAWNVEHGAFWEAEANDAWVEAGLRLADSFVRHGGRRFVAAGSCAEYLWDGSPCSEATTPLTGPSRYGRAKHRLHALLESGAVESGLEVAWGRVFFVYGSGEDRRKLFSSTIDALVAGERVRVRTPNRRLDFIHVDDVAAAFVELVAHAGTGAVNVASGVGTPVWRAIELLAETLGVAVTMDRSGDGGEADVTAETDRISALCDWRPRPLAEGIAELLGPAGFGLYDPG